MGFDGWTFVLQTANFAVLVWLLHRFLYRPILRVIAARKAELEKQYAQAAAARSEAQAQLASAALERSSVAAERDAVLKRAAAQADEVAAARRAAAAGEAAALIEDARKKVTAERADALAEARHIAVDLAAEMARRVIAQIPTTLWTEAWLEKVEQHFSALPPAELQSLADQLSSGAALRIVSASPLPENARELWRTRLARALHREHGLAVEFASDPDLIAGAELYFPAAVLRLTWLSTLEALRAQAQTAAQPPAYADAR